ncbi:MAG: hypothetical protein ACKO2G_14810 [Verrucomicrobiales bacterium]
MNVLPLTILFSSLLAIFFIIAFAVEWVRGRNTSLERESLLPFADDEPVARTRPNRRREQIGN